MFTRTSSSYSYLSTKKLDICVKGVLKVLVCQGCSQNFGKGR